MTNDCGACRRRARHHNAIAFHKALFLLDYNHIGSSIFADNDTMSSASVHRNIIA